MLCNTSLSFRLNGGEKTRSMIEVCDQEVSEGRSSFLRGSLEFPGGVGW